MYYCPKCDRAVSKERLAEIDAELNAKFGKSCLELMRCPVCDTDFIDMNTVMPGGEKHVGQARQRAREG